MASQQPAERVEPTFDYDASIVIGSDEPNLETLELSGFQNTGEAKGLTAGDINILPRKVLPTLIERYRLREADEFPASMTAIDEQASRTMGEFYEVFRHRDYRFPLPTGTFKAAIRALTPSEPFDPDDYTLHYPATPPSETAEGAGVVIESAATPDAWLIEQVYGGMDALAEDVGARVCMNHDPPEEFENPIAACPACGARPEAVQETIENMREAHPGVVALIAVNAVDISDKTSGEDSEAIREAIEEYVEQTGDELLADEERVEEWLNDHGFDVSL